MDAPSDLSAHSGDGNSQMIVRAGSGLPTEVRLVFATERAGQTELSLRLAEASNEPFAELRFELPRGLPANCWIPVFVAVSADLRVSAEARENLRRIRIEANAQPLGESAHFRT